MGDTTHPAGKPTYQQVESELRSLTDTSVYRTKAEVKDKPCDLVMKGGITSGVVYPLAACELAKQYRFQSIGGASAGAIGAVMIAAAEYGRDRDGFAKLAAIPDDIGTSLGQVFTPGDHTTTAHRVLMSWLEPSKEEVDADEAGTSMRSPTGIAKKRKVGGRIARVVRIVVGAQLGRFLLGLLIALVLGAAGSLLVAGYPQDGGDWAGLVAVTLVWAGAVGLVGGVAWAGVRTATTTLDGMAKQGFGICVGSHGAGARAPRPHDPGPFTDWMSAKIDEIAGLSTEPLTFGHLWGMDEQGRFRAEGDRDIDLRVMTTNLTWGRPQSFPFPAGSETYYFDPTELGTYFPKAIVEHLKAKSVGPHLTSEPTVTDSVRRDLCPLPPSEHIPVIVAARLSLSFPGLISAVPLWALDTTTSEPKRCWMTDGGLTANFPIHFFDSPLPGCPTFAIDLSHYPTDVDGAPTDDKADVSYPAASGDAKPSFSSIRKVPQFAQALVTTMQYWADNTQAALPGYRDRIVQVRQTHQEGGMNLQMPAARVKRLAEKGARVARLIAGSPAVDGNPAVPGAFDLQYHQWVRYQILMGRLQDAANRMNRRWDPADGAIRYTDLVTDYEPCLPTGDRRDLYQRTPDWRRQAVTRTATLLAFASAATPDPNFEQGAPAPTPVLRITPML